MERICFKLQLKMETIGDYIPAHESVWAEILEDLSKAGWSNYSLFVDRSDGLPIGYFETGDFTKSLEAMSRPDVNARWREAMRDYFEGLDESMPDTGFTRLEQIPILDK